jgi:hypothetical protein
MTTTRTRNASRGGHGRGFARWALIAPWLVAASLLGNWARASVDGPVINPFACQGQGEALMAERSIAQMRVELDKLRSPVQQGSDPASIVALKWCVVAELEQRVGDPRAADSYAEAVRNNPEEPGYELFWGKYYAGARGARGPVVELAEEHFYRALAKLEALQAAQASRPEHAVVKDQVKKQLLLLYQQDGLPLLPFKAYPQTANGSSLPGVAAAVQSTVSSDTRASAGDNETRAFATEAGLRNFRNPEPISNRELFDIVRNPLRWRIDARLRLRQRHVGALDLSFSSSRADQAQIADFGQPSQAKVDVAARELGVGYERVLPLYPLFDLRLSAGVSRVHRVGVVEFAPDYAQDFTVYRLSPSASRFIGSDKLTLGYTLVIMDIPRLGAPAADPESYLSIRGRSIWAANVEYAFYSPLLLPALHLASLRPYRTPTRGLYLYAGYVNDNEVFGDRRSINETIYAGARLEGPGAYDLGFTQALYRTSGRVVQTDGSERKDDTLGGDSLRSSFVLTRRLVNIDATPGVPESYGPFAPDMLNLVFPVSYDLPIAGVLNFENIRGGAQLWWKVFGTGLLGTTFLLSAGYEYQYFFHIPKHMHNLAITARVGWADL